MAVKRALQSYDVNESLLSGKSPLHRAAYNGSEIVVQLLIDNGARLHARTKEDETPLHLAVRGVRWRGFDGQSNCLFSGEATRPLASKYRCLFSSVPIGITTSRCVGLGAPMRDKDQWLLHKSRTRGLRPIALTDFLCSCIYDKNIVPYPNSQKTFDYLDSKSHALDMVLAIDHPFDQLAQSGVAPKLAPS